MTAATATRPLYEEFPVLTMVELAARETGQSAIKFRAGLRSFGDLGNPTGDIDRVERWMQWKSGKAIVDRAQAKLEAATKRRQKGTNLTLADVAELIALANIGQEPK